jgi:hypothetical protein
VTAPPKKYARRPRDRGLNLVEVWFGIIERQAIHRGTFTSVVAGTAGRGAASRGTGAAG